MELGSIRTKTIETIQYKRNKRLLTLFSVVFLALFLGCYLFLGQIASITQQQTLEANIQEATGWEKYAYQYLGEGSNYVLGGNPKFYLAFDGEEYYVLQVEQDARTVQQVTALKNSTKAIATYRERYNIR